MSKPTALHTEGTAQVSKFISIRKVKAEEEKVKHTHRFKDQISMIQQR